LHHQRTPIASANGIPLYLLVVAILLPPNRAVRSAARRPLPVLNFEQYESTYRRF
jgi:hypothetical protein